MFDFIHDPMCWILLGVLIVSIVGVILSIRFAIRVHKSKYHGRQAIAAPAGIAVFSVIFIFFTISFIIRAFAVYKVVLVGSALSDATFINSKYSEEQMGHIYLQKPRRLLPL